MIRSRLTTFLLLANLASPLCSGELDLLSFSPADPHDLGAAASQPVAVTPDGRFVMISTPAPNLVAGVTDDNGCTDLVLVDRQTATRRLVSFAPGQPNVARPLGADPGADPRGLLSANGQVALFQNANDLWCPFDGANSWFLTDLAAGTVEALGDLVTVPGLPVPPASAVTPRALSADGRRVLLDYGGQVVLLDRTSDTAQLVSRAADDPSQPGNDSARAVALSPDGRYVLFSSGAGDLVTGFVDGNGPAFVDLYRFDSVGGGVILVSRVAGTTTTGAGAEPMQARITPDGNTIVYDSGALELVPGQLDGVGLDVFRFDVASETTSLVSHRADLATTTAYGQLEAVSNDGRWTVFRSPTLLATGGVDGNGSAADDLFLQDRVTDASVLISHALGQPSRSANGPSSFLALSGDGRFVIFTSAATDLVADPAATLETFRFDRTTALVERITYPADQPLLDFVVPRGLVDETASLLVGSSASATLAAPLVDGNLTWDTFVVDLASDALETLSSAAFAQDTTAAGDSDLPVVAADGDTVGFTSDSLEMVPGLGAFGLQPGSAIVYDRLLGAHELVSHSAGNPGAVRPGTLAALSGDGRFVLLESTATDLVAGQIDPVANSRSLFLYDRSTDAASLVSHLAGNDLAAASGRAQGLSADGRFVLWTGSPAGIVPGVPATEMFQLFLYDRTTGANRLVSHGTTSPLEPGNGSSGGDTAETAARLSDDGRFALFVTTASNLVTGDDNQRSDVFRFDAVTEAVRLVSHVPGQPATVLPGRSSFLVFAGQGRFAAFLHQPANGAFVEIYLWDALSGDTQLVLQLTDAPGFDAAVVLRELSPDGRFLLFDTHGAGFASGVTDTNGRLDAFVYDRESQTFRLASPRFGSTDTTAPAGAMSRGFVGNAQRILLVSDDPLLLPPAAQLPGGNELLLVDLGTGARELLTHRPGQPLVGGGPGFSHVAVSRNGASVALASQSSNLFGNDFDFSTSDVPQLLSGGADVFLYRPDGLFADGFESGNLAAWSSAKP
jgi:Tol biopolymer transport system component